MRESFYPKCVRAPLIKFMTRGGGCGKFFRETSECGRLPYRLIFQIVKLECENVLEEFTAQRNFKQNVLVPENRAALMPLLQYSISQEPRDKMLRITYSNKLDGVILLNCFNCKWHAMVLSALKYPVVSDHKSKNNWATVDKVNCVPHCQWNFYWNVKYLAFF